MKKAGIKRMFEALSPSSLSLGSDSSKTAENSVNFSANLCSEHFQVCNIARHGFPDKPICMAFDPVQSLLATGSSDGSIRIFGQVGVNVNLNHESSIPVIQLAFLVNEGALLSVLADDTIHLWNLRQKKPAILHSLRFNREHISLCNIPYQSKWIYIGTERGNVHLCNVESFQLSGYCINWNKAIDISQRKHPGHIVSISEHPFDENKMLIAYSTGLLVLWKFKESVVEYRYYSASAVSSVSWHSEGKQFMSSHVDGKICVWNLKQADQPAQVLLPHDKSIPDSNHRQEINNPIEKLKWISNQQKSDYIVFSGGLHRKGNLLPTPCITIMQGKSVTALEMDFPIIDFVPIVRTPWKCEFQDPSAVAILLEKELLFVDLEVPGYHCLEIPHVLEIHDSPVTFLKYVSDKEVALLQKLQYVSLLKSSSGSGSGNEKLWPIHGGEWNDEVESWSDIFVTGHADGCVRFWNASSVVLTNLLKTKTQKLFEKPNDEPESANQLAVQCIDVCAENQTMVVSNSGSIVIFNLNEKASENDLAVFYINPSASTISCPLKDEEILVSPLASGTMEDLISANKNSSRGTLVEPANEESPISSVQHAKPTLHLKSTKPSQSAGFQAEYVFLLLQPIGESPHKVTCMKVESSVDLFFVATCASTLHIFDLNAKSFLLNVNTGSISRFLHKSLTPKSPCRPKSSSSSFYDEDGGILKSQDSTDSKSSGSKLTKMLSSASFENHLDHSAADGSFSNRNSSTEDQYELQEVVTYMKISVTYSYKSLPGSCLWLGTDLGNLFYVELSKLTSDGIESAIMKDCTFQLNGAITFCEILNPAGNVVCVKSLNKFVGAQKDQLKPNSSKSSFDVPEFKVQYVVVASKTKVKVFTILNVPSHLSNSSRSYEISSHLGEITQSSIEKVALGSFYTCLMSEGSIIVLSLPQLTPLFISPSLVPPPSSCLQTSSFSPSASLAYMCSASEMQHITFMSEVYGNLQESLCNLFTPCQAPERQQDGIIKTLFGQGYSELDRAELFAGKNSGTASRGIATKFVPQIKQLDRTATGLAADMQQLKMKAMERGQKLASVEEKTEEMHESAKKFSANAHAIMLKMKNKKWYQL